MACKDEKLNEVGSFCTITHTTLVLASGYDAML